MALDTSHWVWLNHFFIWGSLIFYVIFEFTIYSEALFNIMSSYFPTVSAAVNTFSDNTFWASFFVTTVVCTLPVVGWRWYVQKRYPTLADKIRKGVWKSKRTKNSSLVSFVLIVQMLRKRFWLNEA